MQKAKVAWFCAGKAFGFNALEGSVEEICIDIKIFRDADFDAPTNLRTNCFIQSRRLYSLTKLTKKKDSTKNPTLYLPVWDRLPQQDHLLRLKSHGDQSLRHAS